MCDKNWVASTGRGQQEKKGRKENALRALLLEEAGPLPEPESGLRSNTGKWTVRDAHPGERRPQWAGAPWWRAAAWGGLGRLPCRMARGLSCCADGASKSLTQSPSWWHRHRSAEMDPRKDSRRWVRRKDRPLVSALDFSWILPAGAGLLVLHSSTSTSCHTVTLASGYYAAWPGLVVLVSGSPIIFSAVLF